MLGGALPYAPATEAAAPAAPDQVQMEIGVTTTETIEDDTFEDNAWNRNGQRTPTLSRRCWWWRCWFFALLENSTFELSLGIWTPLIFSLFHDMLTLLFQSVSPGIAQESSSPFTSSNILRGRLTKPQTVKSRDESFTKKDVQMYNDVQISFFVYLSSHLRTISWITGRFKISASDRSGGSKVRIHRWDPILGSTRPVASCWGLDLRVPWIRETKFN